MMRAIVQDRYGTADEWRLAETATPAISANEVLVQVRAAGLDRGTWHLMTGRAYLIRLLGFGLLRPKHRVPGLDMAAHRRVVLAHRRHQEGAGKVR
jgi:NADPH:quinone reductase-like Zn-dependent oxidoreductase